MLKVRVEVSDNQAGRFGALLAIGPLLRARGIEIGREVHSPDLIWIEDKLLREREAAQGLDWGMPTIVHEHYDSAYLGSEWIRTTVQKANVLALTKEHALRDASLQNSPHLRNRLHLTFLTDTAAKIQSVPLAAPSLAKIRLILPVARSAIFRKARERPYRSFDTRKIDVCYAGGMTYNIDLISQHRRKAVEEIVALGHKRNALVGMGACLDRNAFYDVISAAKIFVSPYGYGEFSWKDYEALFCGCILVKPECDFVQTYGFDIYRSEQHYVKCAANLSNLGSVIESVLDSLPKYEAMSFAAHRGILAAANDESYANDVAILLHELTA